MLIALITSTKVHLPAVTRHTQITDNRTNFYDYYA